jgi:hypothetical protein
VINGRASYAVVAASIAATAGCGTLVGIESVNFVIGDDAPSSDEALGDAEDAGSENAGRQDAEDAGASPDAGMDTGANAGPNETRMSGVCADGELLARGYASDAAAEVVFLGQYGPVSPADAATTGTTLVKVERTRPIVLALFSQQAVTWTLFVAPGAEIQRIVTMGSAPVELKGAPAVPTKDNTAISWSGDESPWTERGADMQAKKLGVMEEVGVGGYAACFRAASFSVRDP